LEREEGQEGQDGSLHRTSDLSGFTQPLTVRQFDKTYEEHTWKQRYWVNEKHYVPGTRRASAVVLDGGETSGEVCVEIIISFVLPGVFNIHPSPFEFVGWIECELTRFNSIEQIAIHYWRCRYPLQSHR
jgi:hypothetical protein